MAGGRVRVAAVGGALLMLFMLFAGDVWPENNPINSSHVVEMVVFAGIATVGAGRFALQPWVDKKFPGLRWLK